MRKLQAIDRILESINQERCYGCFRPQSNCFCAAIPTIDNKTEVLILQHMRERFHPFNTARIVRKSLKNSTLVAAPTKLLAENLSLKPRAGILYPGPGATLFSDLPADQRPEQLVILDGTWHHTKTMMRDIPALHSLPQYRLAPKAPSRYRIRREPSEMFLSTIEATIAALTALEPETIGLDQLMNAFLTMVDRQLTHSNTEHGLRRKRRPKRTYRNIPLALGGDLGQLVVAYAEADYGSPGDDRLQRLPVYVVAQRLGTGESFRCVVQPQTPLPRTFLAHLELVSDDFQNAMSIEEARLAWSGFLRPGDKLAVYNEGVARMLAQLGTESTPCLVLKSVDFNPENQYGALDDILKAEGIVITAAQHPGRAGQRLAHILALVHHLNALASTVVCSKS
jgi:DTW domain-containing protein YfiP